MILLGKLFMAREAKRPTVYWYRGVFRIKGSLGRCLVGGDEMELWPEWLTFIDEIPRLVASHKGVQTMLYYGLSLSIFFYSFSKMIFCEIARFEKNFTNEISIFRLLRCA